MTVIAEVAVIGGSGLYALLPDAEQHQVDTPFGSPSGPVFVAQVSGRRTAFLPRHGLQHQYPPHRIPYRANLWALRTLGVRQILAPCAVGGLQSDLGPGTLVLPDQMIDRTSGRIPTFYDSGAVHVNFAEPYCPVGRSVAQQVIEGHGVSVTLGGTMVVIEGPRFSTRAESQWFAQLGCSVVNMTGYPEAVLARELGMCYTPIALVTDLDAGVEGERGVTQEEVFRVFKENTEQLRTLLLDIAWQLPAQPSCPCGSALDGIELPLELPQ